MSNQRTPKQLQAVKRGQIAATLKREQREAAEAEEQALGGRLKAKMKTKSARPDEVPPWCYLANGRTPEEAAANAAQHFNITLIEALAMVWTLRRWLLAALSEPALYVGIGSGKKTSQRPPKHCAVEVMSADLPANTQSIDDEDDLPPINPANNRSTHQRATA